MSTHARPDPVPHETAQLLLPWLSADALGAACFAAVEAHVAACAECRRDLAWQASLRAAEPADDSLDPGPALARLMPRLGPQARPVSAPGRWRGAAANGAWLRRIAAAQCALIVVLAGMLVRDDSEPGGGDYWALGGTRPVQGDLVLVFRPGTAEADMRRILQAHGVKVVDGPDAAGAWVLALSAGQAADRPVPEAAGALARLRAEPAVALAQPLAAGSRP